MFGRVACFRKMLGKALGRLWENNMCLKNKYETDDHLFTCSNKNTEFRFNRGQIRKIQKSMECEYPISRGRLGRISNIHFFFHRISLSFFGCFLGGDIVSTADPEQPPNFIALTFKAVEHTAAA